MTAVQQMLKELQEKFPKQMADMYESNQLLLEDIALKAKKMEKEQMLNTFQESRLTHSMIGFKHETFADYYNETFKS